MVEWNFEAGDAGPYAPQEPEMTTTHPQAGAVAANQFGTFQVHCATDKQVAFVASLFATRNAADVTDPAVVTELNGIYEQVQTGKVNKKAASRAIDLLLPLPERQVAVSPALSGPPASAAQVQFVKDLLAKRDLTGTHYAGAWAEGIERPDGGREFPADHMTKSQASQIIEELKALPYAKKLGPFAAVKPGMYTHEGRIYRAYLGQQSGKILCKEVVKSGHTWTDDSGLEHDEYTMEYLGLADKHIPSGAVRMTLEEAKVWGQATSSCVKCGRRLDVPESVDAGIGPKCAGKEW